MKLSPPPNSSLKSRFTVACSRLRIHFTSAEGEGKIPGGTVFRIGLAREQGMSFQEEAWITAVPHFVPDAERCPLLNSILQPSWISACMTW